MREHRAAIAAWLVCAAVIVGAGLDATVIGARADAQQNPASPRSTTPQTPGPQTPGQQTPGQQPPATPPGVPGQAAPALPPVTARVFTAPAGLLFNTVRTERVADFERLIAHLQAALEKSSDPMIQAQAKGWKMFKATEPGPNGSVLYVFVLDPAVAGPDYGMGRILADAYPDTAQLQEIWKLYTGSVTSGGSLMNLTPVKPSLTDAPTSPRDAKPAAPQELPVPPDADPNRKPLPK